MVAICKDCVYRKNADGEDVCIRKGEVVDYTVVNGNFVVKKISMVPSDFLEYFEMLK